MSGPLVYTHQLRGGGTITLQFDLDWLAAPIEDCMFVRDLYKFFTAGPVAEQPALPPAPVFTAVPSAADLIVCPDCGEAFSKFGIGSHRRKHAVKAAPMRTQHAKTCEDCGQTFPNGAGLAMHRKHKHPEPPKFGGEAPTEWDLPAHRSIAHEPDSVYRCSDCGEERATDASLSEHTYSAHQRPSRITEQVAVRPKADAA